jgi:hypothetical protein
MSYGDKNAFLAAMKAGYMLGFITGQSWRRDNPATVCLESTIEPYWETQERIVTAELALQAKAGN